VDEIGHRLRQFVAHGLARVVVVRLANALWTWCMVSGQRRFGRRPSPPADRRSSSRATSASGTSGCAAAIASDCAC